jgi:hypothetical protein
LNLKLTLGMGGLVAALLVAFAVFGARATPTEAHTTNLVLSAATAPVGGSVNLAVTVLDDENDGDARISISANAVFTADNNTTGSIRLWTAGIGACSATVVAYPTNQLCIEDESLDGDALTQPQTVNFTVLCLAAGPAVISSNHALAVPSVTLTCGDPTPTPVPPTPTATPLPLTETQVRIRKVDQLLAGRAATFEVRGPSPLTTVAATVTTSAATGAAGLLTGALPAGTYTIVETAAPAGCTLVEVRNASGLIMVAPYTVTIPANVIDADITFVNSCVLPGAPSPAQTRSTAVIGGSTANLTNRTFLEIVPARGSDDDARIDVQVRDSAGTPVPGIRVFFITNKGTLSVTATAAGGISVAEPLTAALFGSTLSGDDCERTVGDIFLGPFVATSPQSGDDLTNASGLISACVFVDPTRAPGTTPGDMTVTIIVDVPTVTNFVQTVTIPVVGPPATVTVSAAPATVRCGERSTITATVRDAIGQNVSDHTRVEFVTNLGGVLAGTGAVFAFAGPVVPVSSTVGETFGGVATAFLLTSESHSGPYEVVVTTGGTHVWDFPTSIPQSPASSPLGTQLGGIFSTPPINAFVQVTCTLPAPPAPAPAPTVRVPAAGGGITPPSTGDGGLVSTTSTGMNLMLIGIAALAVASVVSFRLVRR